MVKNTLTNSKQNGKDKDTLLSHYSNNLLQNLTLSSLLIFSQQGLINNIIQTRTSNYINNSITYSSSSSSSHSLEQLSHINNNFILLLLQPHKPNLLLCIPLSSYKSHFFTRDCDFEDAAEGFETTTFDDLSIWFFYFVGWISKSKWIVFLNQNWISLIPICCSILDSHFVFWISSTRVCGEEENGV